MKECASGMVGEMEKRIERDQIVIKSVAPAEVGVFSVTETAGDHISHSISQPSQQKRCQTSKFLNTQSGTERQKHPNSVDMFIWMSALA